MKSNEKQKRQLSQIYKEVRNTEMQLNRGGINHTEALKIAMCMIGSLTTVLNELLED